MEKSCFVLHRGDGFYACADESTFEQYVSDALGPHLHGIIVWLLFSAGAENLPNATLLVPCPPE